MRELPAHTREWLMGQDMGVLEAKIKKAAKRVSNARRILKRLSPATPTPAEVGWDVARLEERLLDQPRELRSAEDDCREATDELEYLTSQRRYVKIVQAGLPVDVLDVVDFANKRSPESDQTVALGRECVVSCIKELIDLGGKLNETRCTTPGGRMPTLEDLSRQPAVREELHKMLMGNAFQTAGEMARRCKSGHDDSSLLPLAFYGQMVRHPVLSGDHVAQAVWRFLDVVDRTDPRLWRICANCGDVFLQVRRRGDTDFCSDRCRMERHNRSKERMIIRLYVGNGGFREDEGLERRIKEALVTRFPTASRMQEREIREVGQEAYTKLRVRLIEISRRRRRAGRRFSEERIRAQLLREGHRLASSLSAAEIRRACKARGASR